MEEIKVNEEIMDVTVDEVKSFNPGMGLKVAGIALVAGGVGYLVYKKVIKPIVAKRKDKKALKEENQNGNHELSADSE